jgi:Domain of unknown function (DUF4270)
MNKIFFKTTIFIIAILLFASCDKDFNNIGAEILGNDHYGMEKYSGAMSINAAQINTGPIQTNNLDVNPLGIYDNPVFGKTTASFVTQVQLASVAPSLPALNPLSNTRGELKTRTIESVTLYVPYFSKITGTKTSGGTYDYSLDSIVNTNDIGKKIKLSVFENNRYMGDPDTTNSLLTPYLFFSNNTDSNNNSIAAPIGTRLNEDATDPINFPASNNDDFLFKNTEIPILPTTTGGTTTYKAPGINLRLRNSFFNTKILLANANNLKTNSEFIKYFRGLYFKVEQSGADTGCMNMLDFKKGTITIAYKEISNSTDTTLPITDVITDKTIVLNLTGNSASILENSSTIPTSADKLYIKGGEGSVAKINLFGTPRADGKFQEIEDLKKDGDGKTRMINEANLVFNIDNSSMNNANTIEPYRLLLYDMRNKRPIIDYYYDGSTSVYGNSSKSVHGGIIDRVVNATTNPNGRGVKYKIRLTNHIRNLISNDSTNVSLGLAVCKNINVTAFGKQKNISSTTNSNLNFFPITAVMNPLGTIIWAPSGTTVPPGKEMKLEIWYTKSN